MLVVADYLSQQMPPNQMPARRSLMESNAWEQQVGYDVAVAARTALDGAILVNPDIMGFETALNAMMQAFTAIRSGETELRLRFMMPSKNLVFDRFIYF